MAKAVKDGVFEQLLQDKDEEDEEEDKTKLQVGVTAL